RTGLAAQTQVEGFCYFGAVPRTDQAPVGHFLEDPGTAASGVLLVLCRQIGRAHETTGPRGVCTTFPDADATMDGIGEAALVMREGEPTGGSDGNCLRAAQIGGDRQGIDDDAGVEEILGMEETFDIYQAGVGVLGGMDAVELGAGTPVAVIPGSRAAVFGDQLSCLHNEIMEDIRAAGSVEGEVCAHVYASVPEMTVGKPADAVSGHELVLITQIVTEHLDRKSVV